MKGAIIAYTHRVVLKVTQLEIRIHIMKIIYKYFRKLTDPFFVGQLSIDGYNIIISYL